MKKKLKLESYLIIDNKDFPYKNIAYNMFIAIGCIPTLK